MSAERDTVLENKISEVILDFEERIETNQQADQEFQNQVVASLANLNEKLDTIQTTQNNNCDNMGKRLAAFEETMDTNLNSITRGLLSVQQSDLERDCLFYQQKQGMTAKEKHDFEKRWKMYKEMGGDNLEWAKDAVANIPIVNH